MSKFNVGDMVRVKLDAGPRSGEAGTIIKNGGVFYPFYVSFPGGGRAGYDPDELEPVRDAAPLKVGDKVIFTDDVPGSWWFKPGQTGVVTQDRAGMLNAGHRYVVRVDGTDKNAYVDSPHISLTSAVIGWSAIPAPTPAGWPQTPLRPYIIIVSDAHGYAPSTHPVVHTTKVAAVQEAGRLAQRNPGVTFTVFGGVLEATQPPTPVTPQLVVKTF